MGISRGWTQNGVASAMAEDEPYSDTQFRIDESRHRDVLNRLARIESRLAVLEELLQRFVGKPFLEDDHSVR